MAELVDAVDSKSIVFTDVLVRFQSSVLKDKPTFLVGFLLHPLLYIICINRHSFAPYFSQFFPGLFPGLKLFITIYRQSKKPRINEAFSYTFQVKFTSEESSSWSVQTHQPVWHTGIILLILAVLCYWWHPKQLIYSQRFADR